MIRLGTVVLGSDDIDRAVLFWSQVLGYEIVPLSEEDNGFTILVPPSGEGTRVALQQADTPAQEHPRVHLDLASSTPQNRPARSNVWSVSAPPACGGTRIRRTPTSSCSRIQRGIASASSTPATAEDPPHTTGEHGRLGTRGRYPSPAANIVETTTTSGPCRTAIEPSELMESLTARPLQPIRETGDQPSGGVATWNPRRTAASHRNASALMKTSASIT